MERTVKAYSYFLSHVLNQYICIFYIYIYICVCLVEMFTKLFCNWSTPYYCATLHLNTQRQRFDIKLVPTDHTPPLASFDNSRVDRQMASNEIIFVILT